MGACHVHIATERSIRKRWEVLKTAKKTTAYSVVCNKCGHFPYAIDPMTNKLLYRDKNSITSADASR